MAGWAFTLRRALGALRGLGPLLFLLLLRHDAEVPRRLTSALEDLGGAFLKFGQLLATRPDLLPARYIDELSRLFDSAQPFDSAEARRIVEAELGAPLTGRFTTFDSVPVAAASFGQVHHATLPSGRLVVVKVQRPGLEQIVETDIRLIRCFGRVAGWLGLMNRIPIEPVVEEFACWTLEELDYVKEATYCERMRRNALSNPYFYVPEVIWDCTTSRVLTLERIEGIPVSEILALVDRQDEAGVRDLEARGVDLQEVAQNMLYGGLHQLFEEDLFHADPHAGNMIVLQDNRIGLVDFGIAGQIDEDFRWVQLSILSSLGAGKLDQYVRSVLRLVWPPPEGVDLRAFGNEIKGYVRGWQNAFYNPYSTLRERSSGWLFTRNLMAARRYGLSFSWVAVRYYRALSIAETTVLRIDPGMDLQASLYDYLLKLNARSTIRERALTRDMSAWMSIGLAAQRAPDLVAALVDYAEGRAPGERRPVRKGWQRASRACGLLWRLGVVLLVALPVFRLAFPDTYADTISIAWWQLWLAIAGAVLLLAWLSRRCYIQSVESGAGRFVS